MANRHDSHQPGFDDELEHGWAGGLQIEVGDERPSMGLDPDPSARKWVLGGLGASCLLTAAFVLLATHDATPAHAASIEPVPQPTSELAPVPSEAQPAIEPAASVASPSPAPRRTSGSRSTQPPSKADSTLAAASSAAVQPKPRVPTTPKPAAAPQPAVTPKPSAAPKPSAMPQPVAPKPAPVEPTDTPQLPSEASPTIPNAELPDVEPWDEADDQASSADATVPATPS